MTRSGIERYFRVLHTLHTQRHRDTQARTHTRTKKIEKYTSAHPLQHITKIDNNNKNMKTLLLCTTLTILFTFHSWSSIALELESESEANTNTNKCVDNDTSMCDAPCKQTQSSTRTRTCSNNDSVISKDLKRSKVPASRTWPVLLLDQMLCVVRHVPR